MISIALLAVIVVAVVAFGATRLRGSTVDSGRAGSVELSAADAQRWVEAGLITGDQARAITDYERARQEVGPKARVSPAVEALAYVGGILLTVGAGMLVGQFWGRLGVGGRIGVLAGAAVLAGVVGAVVGESEPVTWRLRGFLWALSTVGLAAAAGIFAFGVIDARGEPVALTVAGAAALVSAGYWRLQDRPLQHLLSFAGLAVAIGVAIAWAGGPGARGGLIGLALWLLGGVWAGLAWQRRVPPPIIGFPLGIVLTLIACGIVGSQYPGLAPIVGLGTAAAWAGLGVARSERIALAPGVVGVFVFLPWTLGYYFGDTVGAPVIAMLSGAILLGIVLLLVRRGRGDAATGGWGGHFRSTRRGRLATRDRSGAGMRPAH
jgi:hypothetical protein